MTEKNANAAGAWFATRYPGCHGEALASGVVSPSHVIVTVSPPVSPSVVARILTIQKPRVTAGTLAISFASCDRLSIRNS